jgi:hypothetical protein
MERLSIPGQLNIRGFEPPFSGQPYLQNGKWLCPVVGKFVAGLDCDMRRQAGLKMYVYLLFVDDVSGTER